MAKAPDLRLPVQRFVCIACGNEMEMTSDAGAASPMSSTLPRNASRSDTV